MNKTLYKRRVDGNIQMITFILREDTASYRTVTASYRTVTAPLGGAAVSSEWTYPCAKNIGRANETSELEQARLEVAAKIKKKKEQGYVEDVKDVDKPTFFKCMLAKQVDMDKVAEHHEKTGVLFLQPKIDGMRCLASKNGLMSRAGKPITSVPHIHEQLKPYFEKNPTHVLDGELYNHELKDDFNKIISLCRKTKQVDPEAEALIQYHIYDLIDNSHMDWDYLYRWSSLMTDTPQGDNLRLLEFFSVNCQPHELVDIIDNVAAANLEAGYEGTMIRYNVPYQVGKRNWSLQKIKKFDDDEFTILGFEEGQGKAAELACKCVIKTKQGVTCYPTMTGTEGYRQKVWDYQERYIGRTATIKYFGITKDGSLRHPTVKRIHTSKRDEH